MILATNIWAWQKFHYRSVIWQGFSNFSFSEIKVKLLLQKIFSQILGSGKSRSKIKEKLLQQKLFPQLFSQILELGKRRNGRNVGKYFHHKFRLKSSSISFHHHRSSTLNSLICDEKLFCQGFIKTSHHSWTMGQRQKALRGLMGRSLPFILLLLLLFV